MIMSTFHLPCPCYCFFLELGPLLGLGGALAPFKALQLMPPDSDIAYNHVPSPHIDNTEKVSVQA